MHRSNQTYAESAQKDSRKLHNKLIATIRTMHEIVSVYWKLRAQSQQFGDSISTHVGVSHDEQPAAFFGMACNCITLTIELLDFYYNTWDVLTQTMTMTMTTDLNVDEVQKENSQRVILIQKMCLIQLISSLEFCTKRIIEDFPTNLGVFKGRIYLSKIMERSNEVGLIDTNTLLQWKGLIELRNCLVHNNGYASITYKYAYPGVTLNFVEGAMTHGTIRNFTQLTEWLLRASKAWIVNVNNSFKPANDAEHLNLNIK